MTEKSEVVRTLFEYRDELGRRELSLLKRMARLWLGVEKEVDQEAAILAQVIIQQAESGQTITPQYVYSLQRYKAFAEQAKIEIDYYDKNIIELITKSQLENMNLGLEAANKAILQSYSVSSPSWTQLNISAFETMAGMLGDGTPLSRLISKDYPFAIEQINEALINGVTIGKGYKQIAKDMVEASQMAFERSVLIARTEINRAYRLANTEQYRQSGVVTGFKRLVYKPTACFACLMMDGEVIPVDQELYDHPRGKCILPGQYVSGPVPEAFISRHYNGDIVVIRTASGKLLSVTPNHPILTDHGWIPANLIKEGMNVICDSGENRASGGVRPDEYQVPTLVENIPRSLDMFRLVGVPGSAEDFHGDGIDGEINIIWANRLLYNRIKTDALKHPVQIPLGFRNIGLLPFNAQSLLTEKFKGFWSTFTPMMHSGSMVSDFLGCHSFCSEFCSFGSSPSWNIRFSKSHRDCAARCIKALGNRLLTFAGLVSSDNFINIKNTFFDGILSSFSTSDSVPFGFRPHKIMSLEEIRNALIRNMPSGSNSLYAVASNVIFDRVVKVDLGSFSGHVYNLQTKEQWYFSNGIITHNCSAVPITIGGNTAQWQTGHEWFLELSPEEQRKIMGNTRYEAWKYGQVTDLRDFVYMKPNEIWGPAPAIKNLDQLSIQTIRSFAGKNYFYVPEELSGIFSNKFAEIVYNEAISGGKFSGAYKNFQEQSNKSLDKTIKSLEKRVAEHVEKIITPNKYYKDWLELDEKTKEGIIHNWRSHLEKNKKSLEIAKIVRSERTDKPSE